MIHVYKDNIWVPYPDIKQIRELKEQLKLDAINNTLGVSEKLTFDLDVWGFINPHREDTEKTRVFEHYNTQEEAENEYSWLLNSY